MFFSEEKSPLHSDAQKHESYLRGLWVCVYTVCIIVYMYIYTHTHFHHSGAGGHCLYHCFSFMRIPRGPDRGNISAELPSNKMCVWSLSWRENMGSILEHHEHPWFGYAAMGQKSQKHLAAPNINSLWTRNVKRPCVPSCAIPLCPILNPKPWLFWRQPLLAAVCTLKSHQGRKGGAPGRGSHLQSRNYRILMVFILTMLFVDMYHVFWSIIIYYHSYNQ